MLCYSACSPKDSLFPATNHFLYHHCGWTVGYQCPQCSRFCRDLYILSEIFLFVNSERVALSRPIIDVEIESILNLWDQLMHCLFWVLSCDYLRKWYRILIANAIILKMLTTLVSAVANMRAFCYLSNVPLENMVSNSGHNHDRLCI